MKRNIFLYGAPASGKTTLAGRLAKRLGVESADLDERIVAATGRDIPRIFAEDGESAFRDLESDALAREANAGEGRVVALGGGTLLRERNRTIAENAGDIICLDAPDEKELARRIGSAAGSRPLGDKAKERAAHYASFERRIASSFETGPSLVVVGTNIADAFLNSFPVVADETVASLYENKIPRPIAKIPSGEMHKTIATVAMLWSALAAFGVGRRDTVAAVGGGVACDLTGFAAATWMRGIDWINVPTTLLAMVDASTGGKTGCDLPEGKNLAGAFHAPKLVVIDTAFLQTLDKRNLAAGRAEMIKHEIIGGLPHCEKEIPDAADVAANLKVKIDIVTKDPFEKTGLRALLNCGHTVAHAVEKLSGYSVSHGEAVAIGCVEEARLAEREGLAQRGWAESLAERFAKAGLPTALPEGMSMEKLVPQMRGDKKRDGGFVDFALPCGDGDVRLVRFDLSEGLKKV